MRLNKANTNYTPTAEELINRGRYEDTCTELSCLLYHYRGEDWVILADNSVMSRLEDNANSEEAIFPYLSHEVEELGGTYTLRRRTVDWDFDFGREIIEWTGATLRFTRKGEAVVEWNDSNPTTYATRKEAKDALSAAKMDDLRVEVSVEAADGWVMTVDYIYPDNN